LALKISIPSSCKPGLVFLLSAIALLILAYFSEGYYHPDEHFQILEFARWKLDPLRPEPLPWEFFEQMRPAVQPAMVVVLHTIFAPFGADDPFLIAFSLRILSAGISFLSMWMIYRQYRMHIRDEVLQKWFLLLSFLLWFALYNAVRFSSETWSGAIFIIGFSYLFTRKRRLRNFDFLLTGLILGFSFVFRYQAGFLIAGFFTWLLAHRLILERDTTPGPGLAPEKKMKTLQFILMVAGIAGAIAIGILVDRWFYGRWVLTAWNYFEQNILADKISDFGVEPWWFYLEDVFIRAIPPFSLVFIIGSLIPFILLRDDLLTWTLLPFILLHFVISHKETRFLYPLTGFLPILIIKGMERIKEIWKFSVPENRCTRIFATIFWFVNCTLIFIVFFIPADSQVGIYGKIFHRYPYPATLYYFSDDPYHRALDIGYYKRSDLVIRKAASVAGLDSVPEKKYLIAIKARDREFEKVKNLNPVYSTYPEWIKHFNFNHWLDRTQVWYIYEIEN